MKIKKFLYSFLFVSLFSSLLFSNTQIHSLSFGGISGTPSVDPETSEARSWFIYELEPGESIEDSINIRNSTENEVNILVYPADFAGTNIGGFALKQRIEEMTEVGSWIELEKNEITLGPKERKTIPFTLTLPEEKIDVGEHAGGILIESKPKKDPLDGEGGVALSTRVGVRVYITVPGEVIESLKFNSFTSEISKKFEYYLFNKNLYFIDIPKEYTFKTIYSNTGNISNDIKIKYSIKDLFFENHQEISSTQKITRDTEATSHISWEAPRFGKYEVKAKGYFLESNTLEFTTPKIIIWVLPWDLIIGTIFILLSLIFAILIRKIKNSGKKWKKYKIKKDDSITSLAKKHKISWKKLVKVNKLKPPYSLNTGKTILVPPSKNPTKK